MKKNLLILFLSVLVSGLTAYAVVEITDANSKKYSFSVSNPTIQKVSLSDQLYPDFTFAAETAVKAVVHVKVVKKGVEQSYSLFDFFFGYGSPESVPRDQESTGSGVIITSDGYIVTNNHVIEGADEISVTLEDNKSYKAKLIGADAVTDIALLKIDEQNLPFLTFGDSDALRLGEWVIAIGNPYNLRSTITAGIVSAKARSIPSMSNEFKIESFIQTDAAVNQGNSGGALVNTRGELVGINTAIASRTGAFTGYSFAVPSSITKKIIEDLIDFGTVQRALLGISMQEIDSDLAKEKNLKEIKGVYIAEVSKDGAAYKAGVKESDVLISINDIEVNSGPAVQEQISKYRPKERIRIGILRDGKQKELSVVLESKGGNIAISKDEDSGLSQLFGASVKKASEQSLKKAGVRSGVEVVSVKDGKFKSAGIKAGFIITHINQIPVGDVQEIESVVQRSRRSLLIEGLYEDGRVVYYGMGI
ncbi:MAG: Do family serine endopeptidase [Bacteroidales bacterium]